MEHHNHCTSCFNQRCLIKPEHGMSCVLTSCPMLCGAIFHACKLSEHKLLCPLMRVQCLNSGYGCPVTLARNQMYAHLDVCPAGVVCCTMEWNRWPISCLDYTSYESLSRGVEEAEQLDMALALQDQRTLLESLKVISMSPSAQKEELVLPSNESEVALDSSQSASDQSQLPPPGSAKARIINGINGLNEEHFNKLYDATVETARSLAAALDFVSSAGCVQSGKVDETKSSVQIDSLCSGRNFKSGVEDALDVADDLHKTSEERTLCSDCLSENKVPTGAVKTENAADEFPSKEISFETFKLSYADDEDSEEFSAPQMLSPKEAMRVAGQMVDHVDLESKGDVISGSQRCCGLRGQFFISNARIAAPSSRLPYRPRVQTEDKAVDTSDLEQDDDPMGLGEIDLITAALFFCLEESRECRRISDTVYIDGFHVDFGTQTFTFPAAILVTNTRVGEMASASACDHAAPQVTYPSPYRTLRLGLVLEALEAEIVPHNRYLPPNPRYQHTFPFVCGQSFRRDQFSSHFRNVHGDIHAGLNGWMEQRCPLAYYGCTFSQRRFYPAFTPARVVHDRHLRSFGVQPCPTVHVSGDSQSDQFSSLPMEILWHIAGFLDSFSLCQLSLVSRVMREVCASLLPTRGIVELKWEQRQRPGSHGTVSWQIKDKVWRFSTAFSPVASWGFADVPSMSVHLKKCHFNTVEQKTEPVPLPAMCTARDGLSFRRVLRHIDT